MSTKQRTDTSLNEKFSRFNIPLSVTPLNSYQKEILDQLTQKIPLSVTLSANPSASNAAGTTCSASPSGINMQFANDVVYKFGSKIVIPSSVPLAPAVQ